MPRGRYGSRSGYGRIGRVYGGSVESRLARLERQTPRVETRYFQLTTSTGTAIPATWTSLMILPRIAAGTSATTRSGEWITMKSLTINAQWTFKGNLQQVRLIGVAVSDGSVTMTPTIAIQDKLKADPLWDNKSWTRILFDVLVYPKSGAILPDAASTSQGQVVHRRIHLKNMRLPIHFTGTASTDEGRNFVQIFQIGVGGTVADTNDFDHDGYCTWVNQV